MKRVLNDEKINLFCLAFAGGNKYSYRMFSEAAPAFLNIITLEYPGRGGRIKENFITDVHALVEDLYQQIKEKLNENNYAIYGHSMGGLVAYLLTLKLLKNNHKQPKHLFITGTSGPSASSRFEKLRSLLPQKEFIAEIRELGGMPDEILESEELLEYFEPILRNDFRVIETYKYEDNDPLNIPFTVITGVSEDIKQDDILLWQKESSLIIDFKKMPGKHFFYFRTSRTDFGNDCKKTISVNLKTMNNKQVYLKPNVVFEPLVDKWYAWSHLISPATAAMNIVGRHLTIIESYLLAPSIHANAVLNPKMKGGPFMDFGGGRVDEVQALEKDSYQKQEKVIEFAKAIKELDKLLANEAKGYGLEDLYKKVPEILKGYVELYYDRHNNPGFRFFESLLYTSEFYNKKSQSIALWVTNNDERPFCLSTPRLNEPDVLHLDIPFDHPCINELAKMKRTPQSYDFIKALTGISPAQEMLFETFFTETPPPPYEKYTGDKIRMRYFGHACILVETKEISILVDPLISYYGYNSDVQHFSDADLPDTIDYVLITHNHQDHILFETLLPLRHKIKNLIVPHTSSGKLEDPDLKLMFNNIGFNNVIAMTEMETINFGDAVITSLPFIGEHSDMNILTKGCYLVKIGDFKLIFLADSRIVEPELYKNIHKQVGDVDVLFIGMECDGAPLTWLYGPLLTKKLPRDMDGSRRLAGSDCEKGMALVDIFKPKEIYVYAMGQEPWVEFISSIKYTDESNPIVQSDKLVKLCTDKGIIAERLFGEKELLYDKEANHSNV